MWGIGGPLGLGPSLSEFDSRHPDVMDSFWKGAFSPVIRKHIITATLQNKAVNPETGQVHQEIRIDFGGYTNNKLWGNNDGEGYLYYLDSDYVPEDMLKELLHDANKAVFNPDIKVIDKLEDVFVVLFPAISVPDKPYKPNIQWRYYFDENKNGVITANKDPEELER